MVTNRLPAKDYRSTGSDYCNVGSEGDFWQEDAGQDSSGKVAQAAGMSDWQTDLRLASRLFIQQLELKHSLQYLGTRIETLESQLDTVPYSIQIVFVDSDFCELTRQLPLLVTTYTSDTAEEGVEYTVCFVEANLAATDESLERAVDAFKSRLISKFKLLTTHDPTKLGRLPTKQLAVLNSVLRRIDGA
ncbi:MAG: hypothetical protein Rhob2KO_14550 [Rhodopirellula baltica]